MRAETCVGPNTRLEVVTEGILTRMIQRDPELSGVGLAILDEFHERSLQADLALALLLDVQQGLRDDLKLLIMSATLDNDACSGCCRRRRLSFPKGARFRLSGVFCRCRPISALTRRWRWPPRSCCAAKMAQCCCFCPGWERFSAFRSGWRSGWRAM
jgi:hypothetical protein